MNNVPVPDEPKGVYIDTGRFREFEKLFKKLSAEAVVMDKTLEPLPTFNYTPYLVTILAAIVVGITGVVLILTFVPDSEFIIVSGGVFLFISGVITSIFGMITRQDLLRQQRETFLQSLEAAEQAAKTNKAIEETRHIVNSRMDEFKEIFRVMEFLKGKEEGLKQAENRADALAEKR